MSKKAIDTFLINIDKLKKAKIWEKLPKKWLEAQKNKDRYQSIDHLIASEAELNNQKKEIREKIVKYVFQFVIAWCAVIFLILIFNKTWPFILNLDSWGIRILIGSTTANVFALAYAVIKGAFSR